MISRSRSPEFPAWIRLLVVAGMTASAMPCRGDSTHLIDVWTPYQNLPQSRVLSITQTPDGYLWVATQLGWLARFDGIRFTNHTPEDTPALVSPEIQKVFVDDLGELWIADIDGRLIRNRHGTFENLAAAKPGYAKRVVAWLGSHEGELRFATANGFLVRLGKRLSYENENNPLPHIPESIRQFCQDAAGNLWCRTTGGTLGRWSGGSFHAVAAEELPSPAKVNHLLPKREGGIWIATSRGLWTLDGGRISVCLPSLPADSTEILQLAESSNGNLWLRTPDHLILSRDGEVILQSPLAGIPPVNMPRPLEMHAGSGGDVWILKPGEGVRHFDTEGHMTPYTTRNGLPSDLVDAWFEDNEKNIWLGTAAGLVRLRPRWFRVVETAADGPGSGVLSIAEDPGADILLGRADGLTRWRDGAAENVPLPSLRQSFPIADVTVAPGSSPGDFWVGTVQSGAFLVRNGQVTQPFPFNAPGLAIRVIRRDPAGNIWFGGEYGLFRWDGRSLHKFGPDEGLTPGHIHDISFDQNGDAWIGKANDTLTVFRNGRFQTVPIPGVVPSMRIHSVLCGSADNVWIGTVGAGLLHLTRGKVFRYTENDGLPGNSVTQLLEDDEGFLWGGTHRGIFRVSTTALDMRSKGVQTPFLFRSYSHADGLPAAECSGGFQPACWKAGNGNLWFATTKGAVSVDPKQVRKNYNPPAIIIEEMRIDEQILPLHHDSTAHQIGPGRHRIEFRFTGISLTAPETVSFQWQLEGVDRGWVNGQFQRNVTYTGLAPGNYRFSVRARNGDGVWSLQTADVSFRVQPWLWQRPLVRAAIAATLLALAYWVVAGLVRRKHLRELRMLEFERSLEQQRFRHKQAMESERARIAAELHDDLGASLTQIQWLGDAATRARSPGSPENELIARISAKSREMVRLIDEIVWAVNPKNDNLEQLVTYVCNFAEQFFNGTPTRCRIDIADRIPASALESNLRHHLFLIAKEALHNVAKHAATDRVWVRAHCDAETFHLTIEDRGCGFDAAAIRPGDGLHNMRHRAKLAGVILDIESTPGSGTRVAIQLALKPTPI
jgi:ligand-binding sensor domain-containing protein/signal transduction histidine kinase